MLIIMGSCSGKVLPESSAKSEYFCTIKSVVELRKVKKLDGERCKPNPHACLWRWRSDNRASKEGNSKEVKEPVPLEERLRNPNAKFRAKFDPRITARYDIKALIGRGSFSRVVRAEHRCTRKPFAIKLLEVRGREGHEACQAELGILRRVNHANIIRLAEVFETPHRVYLVLELATGGELLERVVARGTFRECDATRALVMVASGLCYLHTLGVIHRDLKPENLLYYHPGQDSRLIITDFGLACWDNKSSDRKECVKSKTKTNGHNYNTTRARMDIVRSSRPCELDADRTPTSLNLGDAAKAKTEKPRPNSTDIKKATPSLQSKEDSGIATHYMDPDSCIDGFCYTTGFENTSETKDWALRTLCGTPEYLAPEMLARRPISSAVDMWALGVITYILLSGSLPFDHNSRPRLFRAILRGNYSFHGNPWNSVSTLAKSFIERLLTLDPNDRMTAEDALKHPWLVSMAASSSNKNLHRSISRNLQQRASQASSRCPSSSSAPGSQIAMRSGSRPGSGPRLGVGDRSQCSLKIAT